MWVLFVSIKEMSDLNILMIGDIVGKNGRLVVNKLLPSIKKKYNIDFVIATGRNYPSLKDVRTKCYKITFRLWRLKRNTRIQ